MILTWINMSIVMNARSIKQIEYIIVQKQEFVCINLIIIVEYLIHV